MARRGARDGCSHDGCTGTKVDALAVQSDMYVGRSGELQVRGEETNGEGEFIDCGGGEEEEEEGLCSFSGAAGHDERVWTRRLGKSGSLMVFEELVVSWAGCGQSLAIPFARAADRLPPSRLPSCHHPAILPAYASPLPLHQQIRPRGLTRPCVLIIGHAPLRLLRAVLSCRHPGPRGAAAQSLATRFADYRESADSLDILKGIAVLVGVGCNKEVAALSSAGGKTKEKRTERKLEDHHIRDIIIFGCKSSEHFLMLFPPWFESVLSTWDPV